jgi:predicted DNA-binding protein (UPF0251 family)
MNPDLAPTPPPPPRRSRLTSGIVACGAAFGMTLAGLGIAAAQTDDSPTTTPPAASADGDGSHHQGPGGHRGPSGNPAVAAQALGMTAAELKAELEAGKSLAAIAGEKGVDVNTVVAALVADAKAELAEAVSSGRITQAQADAKSAGLEARMTELVNRTPPLGRPEGGDRRGPGHGPGIKGDPAVVAEALGMTPAELKAELQAGKSLATIAGARGVDVNKVVAALVADAKAKLAEAVSSGRITQAQADERSAGLEARITEMVNHAPPFGDGRKGPGGHGVKPSPEATAAALGITVDELRTERMAGKSIATIAGEKGVDVDTVIAALVADAKAKLAEAVSSGRITQAQADEQSATLEARITEHVNSTGGPHDGGPGGHHHGGPRPAGADADDDGAGGNAEPAVLQA